jgi:hypothetical protein
MGTSLNGLTPAGTYPGLIKTGDNAPIDGTLKTLSDGNGNNLPMAVSTTAVNFTNQLQQSGVAVPTASQVAAKQDTLVSGTNIKTINGASLLGSGDIPVVTSPSGVAGAIQFSNGSAFASDAANLFWDDTNNRLGIGTNAPTKALTIDANTTDDGLIMRGQTDTVIFQITKDGNTVNSSELFQYSAGAINFALRSPGNASYFNNGTFTFGANTNLGAKVNIKGSGSTSATTSLLVQNSAGLSSLQVTDDGSVFNYGKGGITTNSIFGKSAFQANSTGVQNASFGWESLFYNSTTGYNSAFGARALYTNTANGNSAFGAYALYSTSNGANNVAVGFSALELNTTGSNNSALGNGTVSGNFSGSLILGSGATANGNNQFVVGSSTTNAGAIDSSAFTQDKRWKVKINGVDYYIALQTA